MVEVFVDFEVEVVVCGLCEVVDVCVVVVLVWVDCLGEGYLF